MHLGGAKLLGMLPVGMDGRQGVRWAGLIRPRTIIPVHYDDYGVFTSPLADFVHHVEAAGQDGNIVRLDRGESCELQGSKRL
ncbi:MBL fold metallo-hydrolase [Nonomuraea sp. NPDC050451]|uniref:MBL fold metallo-hydrolase n=1 Tax=Nonomuraea sp. NPDC050451 TaxID=3364364 RepID=UPI00379F3359